MPRRAGRVTAQKKKAQRFASLRKKRAKQASLFAAVERRQRADGARLQAARRRCIKTTGYPTISTIERRRHEYVQLPAATLPTVPPRTLVAAIALAFALPVIVAIASNLARPNVAVEPVHPNVAVEPVHPNIAVEPVHPNVAVELARPTAVARVHSQPVHRIKSVTLRLTTMPKPQPPQPAQQAPYQAPVIAQRQAPQQPLARHLAQAPSLSVAQAPTRGALVAPRKAQSEWSLTPDGTWSAVVRAPSSLHDASFSASTGQLIALEASALDGDAATVTVGWSRPVTVTISSGDAALTHTLAAPDDSPRSFAATARAIGPHLVNVGWTPLASSANVAAYKVYRSPDESEQPQLVAQLPAVKHSWQDRGVDPGARYRYAVVAETTDSSALASTETISTPPELPTASASALAGKGMFLYFSSLGYDPRSFRHYDPEVVIAEAQKAGIHVIELRMARGSCAMAQTADARAWLDRLIDAAAQANISLIAWTVPRRVTTQDLAQTVAAALYRTPAGNGFVGLALDLETGERYMGSGSKARSYMVQYIKAVRAATGSRYLIVATVASPEMGNHTNEDYPYARIAAYADVLQPMEYWHYFEETSHHEYARREVAGAAAAAVARTRELAGRDIPVDVAGQSVDLQGTGAPSGREILWSLKGAKSAGGIGETFFDWAGTRPDAWAAIQAFNW